MHCIEVETKDIKLLKSRVGVYGAKVEIVSRYVDKGIRLADVEVSKDNRAISLIEQQLCFKG